MKFKEKYIKQAREGQLIVENDNVRVIDNFSIMVEADNQDDIYRDYTAFDRGKSYELNRILLPFLDQSLVVKASDLKEEEGKEELEKGCMALFWSKDINYGVIRLYELKDIHGYHFDAGGRMYDYAIEIVDGVLKLPQSFLKQVK